MYSSISHKSANLLNISHLKSSVTSNISQRVSFLQRKLYFPHHTIFNLLIVCLAALRHFIATRLFVPFKVTLRVIRTQRSIKIKSEKDMTESKTKTRIQQQHVTTIMDKMGCLKTQLADHSCGKDLLLLYWLRRALARNPTVLVHHKR